MARILGVDLPRNKAMKIAIRSLYGVGPKIGKEVLEKVGMDPEKNSNDVTEEETNEIRKVLDEYTVEGDLKKRSWS
jgi:small subunit ribosomal protein S13